MVPCTITSRLGNFQGISRHSCGISCLLHSHYDPQQSPSSPLRKTARFCVHEATRGVSSIVTRVRASMVWQFVTPTLRSPEHRPIHAFLRSLAISVPHSRSITTAIHLNAQDGAIVTYGQASSATVAGTGRRRGERDGGQQSCPLCWPYECPQVSLSSGAAHSYFGAALSSKNKEKKTILRIYGFEGEAGREGEGRTRIPESSRRWCAWHPKHPRCFV